MDYIHLLSLDNEDSERPSENNSESVRTYSAASYQYESEEEQLSTTEGSKVDTNLTSFADLLDVEGRKQTLGKPQDTIRLVSLKRHIDKVRNDFNIKEQGIQKIREQLNQCRTTISNLSFEENKLNEDIQQERDNQNVASIGLLEAKLSKLQTELSTEQRLEQTLIESLKQAELVLADAQCKQREFEEVSHQLAIDEFLWKREKDAKASERHQKETKLALNTKYLRKTQEKELLATQQQLDAYSKEAAERARKAHEDGIRFLRESMDKRRAEEVKEEKKHRVFMENRMNALLELKSDIESSQGSIKALQMLAKHKEMEDQKKMRAEMERVLNEGGNPIEAALWKVKLEQLEKGKESFEKQQKDRQLQIVTKLLDEEKIAQRQEQKKAKSHWHTRMGVSHSQTNYRRSKKLPSQKLTIHPKEPAADTTPPTQSDEDDGPADSGAPPATDQSGGDSVLAEPEFRGLWETDQTSKSHNEGDYKHSKMEDEILQATFDKLRQNIVRKQVAAGREFKGIPFRSKPEEIIFKDLDIGCTYQKKVQLTNVSYTVNFCKLIGISENLQDFITIEFNPPGAMSAGLTCYMNVIFQPKLNEDLEGNIEFLAQTGPFHIPVKCYSKKCLISVDKQLVSFGSVCVGEVSKKVVTITNSGALLTSFQLLPATISSQQSQVSAVTPIVTMREDPSPPQEEPEDGERFEGQLGGKGSRLSASHIIARSKLYPEGSRPLSKSTSRMGEVVADNVVTFSDEKEISITEQPPAIVESEATLVCSESRSAYAPITVGEYSCGDIGGFSSAVVELLFTPDEVGEYTQQFQLVFSHETVQPVEISAQGKSHDLPIYVDREVMELHTCMLDRLYQDSVILYNRASAALRVTFNVPKSLQPHMEVLPHHGVVQSQSPFSAQLKFLPRPPIFSDCQQFFDEDSMLTAPLEIQISDQVRTVPFKVMALVTVSDLEFNTEQVDFGTCTVHESVVVTVKLANKSILPQKFGFIDLPQVINIQPNDGFGTLLPLETLDIDIIFSATNPKEYNFELKCKSAVDRTFILPCKGQGILPAVQLSDNIIHFTAIPVNATSSTSIIIQNVKFNRLSSARIRQTVPPPGKRAFEFCIPKNCPISLSPSVGILEPGQKQLIQVEASPRLDPSLVMKEVKRLIALEAEKELQTSQSTLADNSSVDHPPTASKTSRASRGSKSMRKSSTSSPQQQLLLLQKQSELFVSKHIDDAKEGSDMWWDASRSLLGDYQDQCFQYCITCYVSSPNSRLSTNEPIEHSEEETLYLEVTLPVIRPSLMVISDHGKDTVDFGDVVNGESVTRTVILKNTGAERLIITSSILDPHGPFHISNAFRKLPPNATHNMLVTFTPTHGTEIFFETLILYYGKGGSLRLGLKGQSIEPGIELSIEDDLIDMGNVITNDFITQSFQLTNKSPSIVKYQIKMESTRVGTSNYDGHVVFDCVPAEGSIMAGNSNKINVNFNPDHASLLYNDLARVYISNKERFVIKFTGRAFNTALFIKGGDDTSPLVESLAAVPLRDEDTPEPLKSVFLSFTHFVSQPEKSVLSRTLEICSIKSTLLKKSNGDFTFEPLPATMAKMFTIDPMKSSVEAGSKKPITVTFQPPVSSNTTTPMIVEANLKVTLKSESVEQYKLILQARIYD